MMTYREKILEAHKSGHIVRIRSEDRTEGHVDGFVAAVGVEFFALEIFNETIHLDGLNCMRFTDVTGCESPAPYHEFKLRVIEARNLKRAPTPELNLSSLRSLLQTSQKTFPIATLHMQFDDDPDEYEEDLSDVCYIGEITKVRGTNVVMRCITPGAEWDPELETFDLNNVYRVDFGGGYEEALLLVLAKK